jgi:hypothetical protein
MTCQMTMSLGVYVLGAADAAERSRVEAHLPGCAECQAELTSLAVLPGLLTTVPDELRPASRAAAAQPRLRRFISRPLRAAAAVASLAVTAGFALGYWLMPAATGQAPAAKTFTGVNPATHVAATAALTPTTWGTSIQLRLQGVPLHVECRLIARSLTGATEVSGVWDAWRNGPVNVPASAGWPMSDIASLQIVAGTKTLVTISIRVKPARPTNS